MCSICLCLRVEQFSRHTYPCPTPRRRKPLCHRASGGRAASRQDGQVHNRAAPRPDGQDAQHPEHERHRARCARLQGEFLALPCTGYASHAVVADGAACMPAVDHGKSTLTDSLVAAAGIIAMETVRRITQQLHEDSGRCPGTHLPVVASQHLCCVHAHPPPPPPCVKKMHRCQGDPSVGCM